MEARDTFLVDIIAHPDDDTPRLIFADWLDDQDQPLRAELIRLQCELAEMDRYAPNRARLLKREAQLIQEHGQRWQQEEKLELVPEAGYERGFIQHGSFHSPYDYLTYASELHELTPLISIRFGELEEWDSQTGIAPSLQEFVDSSCASTFQRLALNISDEITTEELALLGTSSNLSGIRVLDLSDNTLLDESVDVLAEASQLTCLET